MPPAAPPPAAPGRPPRRAVLASFAVVALGNAVIVAIQTPLGWGLRGSAYEPGRPTDGDVASTWALRCLLVAALALNLGLPGYLALRRRWPAAAGAALGWAAAPLSYALGLLLMAAGVRLLWPLP